MSLLISTSSSLIGKTSSELFVPTPGKYAAGFDGSNFLTRGAALSGVSNSKVGLISGWIKVPSSASGSSLVIFSDSINDFYLLHLATSGLLRIVGEGLITDALQINSTVSISYDQWVHFLASWDLVADDVKLYIDDIDRTVDTISNNDDITYSDASDFQIGSFATGAGSFIFENDISELYINTDEYLDLSVEANRRKFISASGKPVNLGHNGWIPTGTAPIVYLNNPFDSFGTNKGSGGNFTETGTLTDASPGAI